MAKRFEGGINEEQPPSQAEQDAWTAAFAQAVMSDDAVQMARELSKQPRMEHALLGNPFPVSIPGHPNPMSIFGFLRVAGARRCLRELSRRCAAQGRPEAAEALVESMDAFEAGSLGEEPGMLAIWDGMKEAALSKSGGQGFFSAPISLGAPMAARTVFAHAARQSAGERKGLRPGPRKGQALLHRALLAIAEGDDSALAAALDAIVKHGALGDDGVNFDHSCTAAMLGCAIGCDRLECIEPILERAMRLARTPGQMWCDVFMAAITIESMLLKLGAAIQPRVEGHLHAAFRRALREDSPQPLLSVVSRHCREQFTALAPCMLGAVSAALAEVEASELQGSPGIAIGRQWVDAQHSTLRV